MYQEYQVVPRDQTGVLTRLLAETPAAKLAEKEAQLDQDDVSQMLDNVAELLGVSKDSLLTLTKEQYLENVEHGWIFRVLAYRGPETDNRMARRRNETKENLLKTGPHITEDIAHPFDSGESSSWTFLMREKLKKLWLALRIVLSEGIKNSTQTAELQKVIQEIRADVEARKNAAIDAYCAATGISKDRVYIAGSGAFGIFTAVNLFGRGQGFSSTLENGSELVTAMGKENAIRLRVDDGEMTNRELSHQEVANGYINDIKAGKRIISFTLCSKTGLRYDISHDNQPSALSLVAEYVKAHNEAYPDDKVTMLADAVQLAGRIPLKELIALITSPPFVGGDHSCSKEPGGSPHIGIFVTSEAGAQTLQATQARLTDQETIDFQVVAAPEGHRTSPDLLTELRVIDNIEALLEAEEVLNHPDYHNVVEQVRATYVDIFTQCGFNVLANDTPTIIAFEPPVGPQGMPVQNVDEVFLVELAKNGISCGGFLKEGRMPMLRFGISIRLLRMVMFEGLDLNGAEFQGLKQRFLERVQAAKEVASQNT